MKIIREALDSEPILKFIFMSFKYIYIFTKWLLAGLLFGFGDQENTYNDNYEEERNKREEERKKEEEHHRLGGQLQWEQDNPR